MNREIMQQALHHLAALADDLRRIPSDIAQTIAALEAELAKPEQEPFAPDWVNYRQGLADGAAQPEQEEPLPLVDIGVDVTPEGTHVVACYNRPDAVQEMFYSQFHPLAKPEQEPVAYIEKGDLYWCDDVSVYDADKLDGLTLYTAPPRKEWVGLTDKEIDQTASEICFGYIDVARAIEAQLKELNT